MKIVVFVPGIMGSSLAVAGPGGAAVWPPTPIEAKVTGYKRIALLVRPDLAATGVIRDVCIDFYGTVLDRLAAGLAKLDTPGLLVEHPYDWRRDLAVLADELSAQLDQLLLAHGADTEIVLVCHSMGGLIARACLERPRANPATWARAVRLAVFLAVPHQGAPLAFARAIGVGGGSVGLSPEQQRLLCGLAGFPAAYQLFSQRDLTPIWRLDDPTPFAGVGVFDPALVGDQGLNAQHLASAAAFQGLLAPSRRPDACRYFSIVSATHRTVVRFDERGGTISAVAVEGTGDGTVPVSSAAALSVQTAYVDADHVGVTQNDNTLDLLDMLLGVRQPEAVAAGLNSRKGQAVLSLNARVIGSAESYEIVVAPGTTGEISGVITIESETDAGAFTHERDIPIGLAAPGATRLSLNGPRLPPGRHLFRLRGTNGVLAETELVVMHQTIGP